MIDAQLEISRLRMARVHLHQLTTIGQLDLGHEAPSCTVAIPHIALAEGLKMTLRNRITTQDHKTGITSIEAAQMR